MITVKIVPCKGYPPGKLADAELHFTEGPLKGLKLVGFSIWERHSGGGRDVTFPERLYLVNGKRRSFVLLRPVTQQPTCRPGAYREAALADTTAQDRVRDLVLQAYAEYEEAAIEGENAETSK